MKMPVRYVAKPTHVREVSLLGTADLAFWTTYLRQQNLLPVHRSDRAQILIVAGEMTFLGIQCTEVSFSVRTVPVSSCGSLRQALAVRAGR